MDTNPIQIMNQIAELQNHPDQLRLLRARAQLYNRASLLSLLQLFLTVIIPVVGAVYTIWHPDFRASVAALSLAIVAVDAFVLDRQQKLTIRRAAKVIEEFDCAVLELPWDSFTAGEMVETEDIHNAATAYSKSHDDAMLMNWYPALVAQAPLYLGRIICQRANLRYGSQLRRGYSAVIGVSAALLLGFLTIGGFAQNLPMNDWVLSVAPATPILAWAAREYYRQRDTAEALEELLKHANKFWEQARSGECSIGDCAQKSRDFQNAIYSRRANSPHVLSYLYRLKRSKLEEEMHQAVAELLRA
jgi:hypothetical protein